MKKKDYIGIYPENSKISISTKNPKNNSISYWLINNKKVFKQKLSYTMKSDTVIAPVFKD